MNKLTKMKFKNIKQMINFIKIPILVIKNN